MFKPTGIHKKAIKVIVDSKSEEGSHKTRLNLTLIKLENITLSMNICT